MKRPALSVIANSEFRIPNSELSRRVVAAGIPRVAAQDSPDSLERPF